MSFLKRTVSCGELRKLDIGRTVILNGWVDSARDHGGLVFVDLRDRYGLTQVVFNPAENADLHAHARELKSEYVIAVEGKVQARPSGTINAEIATGEIEVHATKMELLSAAETPPFEINDRQEVGQEVRLKYRFLDLRRPSMQKNLILRHAVAQTIRQVLNAKGFLEIETPFLTRSTPEGARDFLVPSRMYPGHFYALPQSPQLFKQMFMVSGLDKYYQIVRCFRDEDLRGDRQPEFTQLDLEMSFVERDDVLTVVESVLGEVMHSAAGKPVGTPFPRITWAEAMNKYGSDKPDRRFAMELADVTDIAAKCGFRVFADVAAKGGTVRGINASGAADKLSRKDIDVLTEFVKGFGAKGLAWMKVEPEGFSGPIAKFFTPDETKAIRERLAAKAGDLLFFVADEWKTAIDATGRLRLEVANRLGLIPADKWDFFWVVDFPMFSWNKEEKRWDAEHHPFTSPNCSTAEEMKKEPGKLTACSYDLVLNGNEIGSGSIRIHKQALQSAVFDVLGISPADAEEKFGFLLAALKYGAPPHGGFAVGLDRIVMILAGAPSLREVIAFPKTQRAICPVTGAPGTVSPAQLKELGLKVVE
jgi:aspartyl-tRNA synthetase